MNKILLYFHTKKVRNVVKFYKMIVMRIKCYPTLLSGSVSICMVDLVFGTLSLLVKEKLSSL